MRKQNPFPFDQRRPSPTGAKTGVVRISPDAMIHLLSESTAFFINNHRLPFDARAKGVRVSPRTTGGADIEILFESGLLPTDCKVPSPEMASMGMPGAEICAVFKIMGLILEFDLRQWVTYHFEDDQPKYRFYCGPMSGQSIDGLGAIDLSAANIEALETCLREVSQFINQESGQDPDKHVGYWTGAGEIGLALFFARTTKAELRPDYWLFTHPCFEKISGMFPELKKKTQAIDAT